MCSDSALAQGGHAAGAERIRCAPGTGGIDDRTRQDLVFSAIGTPHANHKRCVTRSASFILSCARRLIPSTSVWSRSIGATRVGGQRLEILLDELASERQGIRDSASTNQSTRAALSPGDRPGTAMAKRAARGPTRESQRRHACRLQQQWAFRHVPADEQPRPGRSDQRQ